MPPGPFSLFGKNRGLSRYRWVKTLFSLKTTEDVGCYFRIPDSNQEITTHTNTLISIIRLFFLSFYPKALPKLTLPNLSLPHANSNPKR